MVTPFLAEASLGENTDTVKIDEGEYLTNAHGFSDKHAQRVSWIGPTVVAVFSLIVTSALGFYYHQHPKPQRKTTSTNNENQNQSENTPLNAVENNGDIYASTV